MTNSQKLKQLRAHLGLSQSELAKKYDINLSAIQLWEQGNAESSQFLNFFVKTLEKEMLIDKLKGNQ